MSDLMEEYGETQAALLGQRETDPLAIATVPLLADETYRRGLEVLSDALELQRAARGSDRERLKDEITELDRELAKLTDSGASSGEIEINRSLRASHTERLELLEMLQARIDQLLFQAHRCESSLHRTRIELAAIRAGGSHTGVTVVIEIPASGQGRTETALRHGTNPQPATKAKNTSTRFIGKLIPATPPIHKLPRNAIKRLWPLPRPS